MEETNKSWYTSPDLHSTIMWSTTCSCAVYGLNAEHFSLTAAEVFVKFNLKNDCLSLTNCVGLKLEIYLGNCVNQDRYDRVPVYAHLTRMQYNLLCIGTT